MEKNNNSKILSVIHKALQTFIFNKVEWYWKVISITQFIKWNTLYKLHKEICFKVFFPVNNNCSLKADENII